MLIREACKKHPTNIYQVQIVFVALEYLWELESLLGTKALLGKKSHEEPCDWMRMHMEELAINTPNARIADCSKCT